MSSGVCHCGCDHFTYSVDENYILISKLCKNCQHVLADHMTIARSRQAE